MNEVPVSHDQVAPPNTPYGAPLSIGDARIVMAAAESEAARNQWGVSVAVVDSGGHLLMLHRLENAQLSSVRLAEAKARTAVEFRRPTKLLEDAVASGGIGLRVLTFGACLAEGGVPILIDGKIAGAIGVSGVASYQDAQVAAAGAAAI
jgi:glc operon protein GlcG